MKTLLTLAGFGRRICRIMFGILCGIGYWRTGHFIGSVREPDLSGFFEGFFSGADLDKMNNQWTDYCNQYAKQKPIPLRET